MNPEVSVFVPTYNASKYLCECLDSLLNQSYPIAQIVICDDASTDGTQEIILNYQELHPQVIQPLLHKKIKEHRQTSIAVSAQ